MKKEAMNVIYVEVEERFSDDFKPPASFFIVDALDRAVYFCTRSRAKAQEEADNLYGKGKYLVRAELRPNIR